MAKLKIQSKMAGYSEFTYLAGQTYVALIRDILLRLIDEEPQCSEDLAKA